MSLLIKAFVLLPFCVFLLQACEPTDKETDSSSSTADYLARAENYYQQGQFKASLIELKNALKSNPNDSSAYILMSEIYSNQGNYSLAIQILENLKEKNERASILVAENYILLGKANSALDYLNSQPASKEQHYNAQLLISKAKAHLILNDIAKAETLIDQISVSSLEFQELSEIELVKSKISKAKGNKADEVIFLQKAVKLNPKNHEAKIQLGRINFEDANYEQAEDILTTVLYDLPTTDTITVTRIRVLKAISQVLTKQGRTSEALVYAKLIADAAPQATEIENEFNTALQAINSKNLEKAESILNKLYDTYNNRASGKMLGLLHFNEGDYEKASELFRNSIDTETASPAALALYAETELRLKNPKEALIAIESNIGQNTKNIDLLKLYAIALLASGQKQKAIEVIKSALDQNPSEAIFHLLLAENYNSEGDKIAALKQLELGNKHNPNNLDIKDKLIIQYLILHKERDAKNIRDELALAPSATSKFIASKYFTEEKEKKLALLREAHLLDSSNIQILTALSIESYRSGYFDQSQEFATKTLDLDRNNLPALVMQIELGKRGNNAFSVTNYLTVYAKKSSDIWAADFLLARHFINQGLLNKARSHIDNAAKKSNQNTITNNLRKNIYYLSSLESLQRQKTDESKQWLLSGLQIAPDDPLLLYQLVHMELLSGNVIESEKISTRLTQIAPNSTHTSLANGDISLQKKEYNKALEFYLSAWKKTKNDKVAMKVWKTLPLSNNSTINRKKFIDEWIKEIPKSHHPLTLKAITFQQEDNIDLAINLYQKSLDLYDKQPIALNNMAWLLFQQNDIAKSIEYAEKAVDISPENPAILDTLGWILYKNGEPRKALTYLEKAKLLAPKNEEIKSHYETVNTELN